MMGGSKAARKITGCTDRPDGQASGSDKKMAVSPNSLKVSYPHRKPVFSERVSCTVKLSPKQWQEIRSSWSQPPTRSDRCRCIFLPEKPTPEVKFPSRIWSRRPFRVGLVETRSGINPWRHPGRYWTKIASRWLPTIKLHRPWWCQK